MDLHYVVAYDISCDDRRRKVLGVLKNYGMPVQYSIVECDLDRQRLEGMKREVLRLIDMREDRVHVYGLCENCYSRSESFGRQIVPIADRL